MKKEYYWKDPEAARAAGRADYWANRDRHLESTRRYRLAHKDEVRAAKKRYASENRERLQAKGKEYYSQNRDSLLAKSNEWRKANPDYNIKRRLRHHGLSAERYQEILKRQGGGCAICGTGGRLVIDHDHKCCPGKYSCGKCVRGLLCHPCNQGIGHLEDDMERMRSAMEYLGSI